LCPRVTLLLPPWRRRTRQRDPRELGDQEHYEHGGEDREVLPAPEHGGAGDIEPEPQGDLTKVVRVSANTPQTGLDKLSRIVRVQLEQSLLHVCHNLDNKASSPNCPPDVVLAAKGWVSPFSVENQAGDQGDEHPQSLYCPELEEDSRIVSGLIEPIVLPILHDPQEQEGPQSAGPGKDHVASDSLPARHGALRMR